MDVEIVIDDTDGDFLVESHRQVLSGHDGERVIVETRYYWNSRYDDLRGSIKVIATYEQRRKLLISSLDYYYVADTEQWMANTKREIVYDENAAVVSDTQYGWCEQQERWRVITRI